MVQSIRIVRKKEDDIWALYIVEFLKFIGCLITDCIVDSEHNAECVGAEHTLMRYDVDIIFQGCEKSVQSVQGVLIQYENGVDDITDIKEQKKLIQYIVGEIWKGSNESKELIKVGDIYAETNMFYYLYQEGNLKFMQEYYSLNDIGNDASELAESRANAYRISLEHYIECYGKLNIYRDDPTYTKSVYFEYVMLNLCYRINDMSSLLSKQNVFDIESMLQTVWEISERNPNFVRIYYLAAGICKKNTRYWCEVEDYYQAVLDKLERQGLSSTMSHFVLYQWGRFQEKILNDKDKAIEKYVEAYRRDTKGYRTLYKLMQYEMEKRNKGSAIELANQIISLVLNGYQLSTVMPKEKIYAFKTFVFLGDIYVSEQQYDLALRCYQSAEQIAISKNEFFDIWNVNAQTEGICFESNFRSCMPLQPLYFKIINCAAQGGQKEHISEYYAALYGERL